MMNLPQFLKLIDDTTSKMTKEELAESIHHIARTLPEERREWLLSMLSADYIEKTESKEPVSDDLYNDLAKIISGEYRLDSEYNEEWDDWYASDEPDFLFEDNDDLLSVIEDAYAELHRLIDCAKYEQARRLGHILLDLEVQADGDYPDYENSELRNGGYATLTYVITVGGTREKVEVPKLTEETQFSGSNCGIRIADAQEVYLLTLSGRTDNMGAFDAFAGTQSFFFAELLQLFRIIV